MILFIFLSYLKEVLKMKKTKFLAFSSVFLLVGSIFISALKKPLKIVANDAVVDSNNQYTNNIYGDIIQWDYLSNTLISGLTSEVLQYVCNFPNFYFYHDYQDDLTYFLQFYLDEPFESQSSYILTSQIYFLDNFESNDIISKYYFMSFPFIDLGDIDQINMFAKNVVLNDIYFFSESGFRLVSLYCSQYGGMYHIGQFIESFRITYDIVYYNNADQVLSTYSYFSSDFNSLLLTDEETGIEYFCFLNSLLNVNNQYNFRGYITLSNLNVYIKMNTEYSGPPPVMYFKSVLSNEFEKPSIFEAYSDKIINTKFPTIDWSSWLIVGVGGFLSFEIIPGFSFALLLAIILAIPLVKIFLNFFAGG